MAQLIVRNLEEEVVRLLRLRAAQDGVSVEEAHRRLLRRALLQETADTPLPFKDYLLGMPGAEGDAAFHRLKEAPRNVDDVARTGVRLLNPSL